MNNEELTELEEIQKRGANAYCLGISYFDNPYYMRENMPAATGEPIKEWSKKELAWRAGWEMEAAIKKAKGGR
jgi:hypothetical protein